MNYKRLIGRFIKSFILLITIIIFTFNLNLYGQDRERISIPSTRINIIPPLCYKLAGKSPILFCESTGATLTIIESPRSPQEIFPSYSDSNYLAEQDFKPLSHPEKIIIDGIAGMKFSIFKRSGLLSNHSDIFQVFVAGDSLGTFTAIASYSDSTPSDVVKLLIASIYTIKWDHTRELTPMDILGFTVSPPAEMKQAYAETHLQIFTPDGTRPTQNSETPYFSIRITPGPISLEYFREDDRKIMMESLIANVDPKIKISQVVEFNKTMFDGISTFETISTGKNLLNGNSTTVYYTVLFHPKNLIIFTGIANANYTEQYINAYKEAAKSFQRKVVNIEEHSDCATLLSSHNYNKALSCFENALEQNPSLISARLGRAEALRLQGKYDQAIKEYSRVLEIFEFCEKALLGRARSFVMKNEYSQAITDFTIALQLNGKNISGYLERAYARTKSFDPYGAKEDYERAIASSPDSSGLYVALGDVQPIDEAIKSYSKAIEIDKSNKDAYKQRATMYLIRKQYQKAISDLTVAIRLKPQDKELFAMRGNAFSQLGKLELALHDMANGPENAQFLISRGFMNGIAGKVDASMKDFSLSIQLDSTEWMLFFLRGIINYLDNSYDAASKDLRKAVKLSASAEARTWLYFCEAKLYNINDAKYNLDRYYSSNASNSEDWHNIVKFLLGKIDEKQLIQSIKPYKKGERISTEQERLDEAKCDTYFAIGMKNYTTGLKVGAKQYWKKCLQSKRTSLVSYEIAEALLQGAWKNK